MSVASGPLSHGNEIVVPLPPGAMEHFTDEAKAYVHVELQRYVADVTSRARHRTAAEVVVKDDVDAIVSTLRPKPSTEKMKLGNDWIKRGAFLVFGLALAQGREVYRQNPVKHGSITWLLIYSAISAGLIAAAIVIDIMVGRDKK